MTSADAVRPSGSTEIERHQYDVVVIGAGGAGLRAVIEARERGLRVAVVTKSLFGKAHTVMAEGGCAAAMRNVNTKDSWQVHFGDTMRGGKFLNNWRMAELHAQEAPDRVWELETYGALFDRTKDGRITIPFEIQEATAFDDGVEQALHESNKVEYGLTAGIFSGSRAEIEHWFDNIESGVCYANRPQGATTGAWPGYQPFGGWKGSGATGKAGGSRYYLPQYLREQSQTRVTSAKGVRGDGG